jgi:putative acetyltransferase
MASQFAATYQTYQIRSWQSADRQAAAQVIATVLAEYGLDWEPEGADRDVLAIETDYQLSGGEFWVVEAALTGPPAIIGTAAYRPYQAARPDHPAENAVEIRKMYLLPQARGQGLGRYLLQSLETRIAARGFDTLYLETASLLQEAVGLYEASGYGPTTGVETARCDRIYRKALA